MIQGQVRNVSDKGFGFIVTGAGKDYFFHKSALQNYDWNELQADYATGKKIEVTFEATEGPKGPRAEYVSVID